MKALAAAAAAAALLLLVAVAAQPLAHDDLFGHLATGERIAASGEIPTADFLSHTRGGARWVSHEWGFSLLAWGVWRVGGLWGLLVFKVLLVLAFAAMTGLLARRLSGGREALPYAEGSGGVGGNGAEGWVLAGALAAVGGWAVSRELILRAALPGALCFAGFALLLLAFRARPRWGRGLAAAALVLVWANVHSGVVFGLFLVALFALEAALAERDKLAAWVGLGAACGLAALVNPNGFEALLYPFRLAALLGDPESGFTAGHFTGGWRGPQLLLGLLVLAALAGWLLRLRQRDEDDRDPRAGLPAAWLLAVAVFAVLSWKTDRLALELVALAVPTVHALWVGWAANRGGWPKPVALAIPGLALVFSLVFAIGVFLARPPGAVSPAFPSKAADWLEENGVQGRLFNHQNWGAYLYWRLREPIFWDGRNDVFAPIVREVVTTPFHEIATEYDVGTLVLSRREFEDLRPELASGRWQGVYADETAAIFVRRVPPSPE